MEKGGTNNGDPWYILGFDEWLVLGGQWSSVIGQWVPVMMSDWCLALMIISDWWLGSWPCASMTLSGFTHLCVSPVIPYDQQLWCVLESCIECRTDCSLLFKTSLGLPLGFYFVFFFLTIQKKKKKSTKGLNGSHRPGHRWDLNVDRLQRPCFTIFGVPCGWRTSLPFCSAHRKALCVIFCVVAQPGE